MPAMRPAFEFGLRAFVVVAGVFAVFAFSVFDRGEGMSLFGEPMGYLAVPLWAYAGAHAMVLAGFLKRGACRRLAFALPVFALTVPMTYYWGMNSLSHRISTIRPGMDVAEVRRIMEGFTEAEELNHPSIRREIGPDDHLSYRDPIAPSHHNAWGTIRFRDGRATDVSITPD